MYRTQAEEHAARPQTQSYYHDINQISLLSAAEERELADAIARGDRDARGRMIKANLRLVVKIARDYMGRGLVLDDLVGEGNVGLIRAAEEYDPRFGTRFSTYASYWIKQAIRHALINTTATIRLPAHMYTLLTKFRRTERLLCRQQGGPPSFDEVAAYLGLSETQKGLVAKAHRARQLKLESGIGDEHGAWSPEESADAAEAVEDSYEVSDERAEVLRRLEWLDDRERLVLSLRYGLAGEQPLTLKEIGHRLGVTREWVRKIELKAVSKMASKTPPAASTSTSLARAAAAAKPRARRTSPFAATAGASSWR
jgi:RNA polymerase primary sigma factor